MTVQERFCQHLKPSTCKRKRTYKIYNAINKYGTDNFWIETLEDKIPISQLDEKEIYYIEKYDSYKNGYNSTNGGNVRRIYKMDDIQKIYQLARQGVSCEDIGKIYGVNKGTIFRTLHGNGLYIHDQIDEEQLKLLFEQGLSNKEIANKLNSKEWTIERRLHKLGLRRRRIYIQRRTDINVQDVFNDYKSGMTVRNICQKYDLDSKTYYKIIKDYKEAISKV